MQTSYSQNQPIAFAGLLADVAISTVDSFSAETAIGFGIPVIRGTNKAKQVKAVSTGGDAAKVIGIAIHDQCHEQSAYNVKDTVNVMTAGRAWVQVAVAVVAGDAAGVSEVAATKWGKVDATYLAVNGAKFISSAAANGFAIVEIK